MKPAGVLLDFKRQNWMIMAAVAPSHFSLIVYFHNKVIYILYFTLASLEISFLHIKPDLTSIPNVGGTTTC